MTTINVGGLRIITETKPPKKKRKSGKRRKGARSRGVSKKRKVAARVTRKSARAAKSAPKRRSKLDTLAASFTTHKTFRALCRHAAESDWRPTLLTYGPGAEGRRQLANAFDRAMERRGSSKRAWRGIGQGAQHTTSSKRSGAVTKRAAARKAKKPRRLKNGRYAKR